MIEQRYASVRWPVRSTEWLCFAIICEAAWLNLPATEAVVRGLLKGAAVMEHPLEHPHIFCSDECAERTPEGFDCFDDGCPYECCGCGSCTNEAECPASGRGLAWHTA